VWRISSPGEGYLNIIEGCPGILKGDDYCLIVDISYHISYPIDFHDDGPHRLGLLRSPAARHGEPDDLFSTVGWLHAGYEE